MRRQSEKCTSANKRFGAMAVEARNNGSGEFEISCAAERVVEAATSPSRLSVVCKPARARWKQTPPDFDRALLKTDKSP